MKIVKKIKPGDICIYNGDSLPDRFENREVEVIHIDENGAAVKVDNKNFLCQMSELHLVKTPRDNRIITEDDPYGEERWNDMEYDDAHLKPMGFIKSFLGFAKEKNYPHKVYINREINKIIDER